MENNITKNTGEFNSSREGAVGEAQNPYKELKKTEPNTFKHSVTNLDAILKEKNVKIRNSI